MPIKAAPFGDLKGPLSQSLSIPEALPEDEEESWCVYGLFTLI